MKIIFKGVLSVVLVVAITLPADAAVLKIATGAPEGSLWMRKMRDASREIQERTDGEVKFKFYAGGVMGNDRSVMRKIHVGQLQGGAFLSASLEQISPDMRIYGLPFLFKSYDEIDYLREKIDAELATSLENEGYVTFGFAEGGFARLMSGHPVRSTEDLKGRKIWVPDGDFVSHRIMKKLGLAPVTLPVTDAMTGLQAGLIEVIGASPVGALAFQWHTRIDYITDVPLVYLFGAMIVDKKVFDRISAEDRTVVRTVMGRVYAEMNRQNRKDNQAALEAMEKAGIEIIDPGPEVIGHWQEIAAEINEQLRNEGAFSTEIYDKVRNFLQEYRNNKTARTID